MQHPLYDFDPQLRIKLLSTNAKVPTRGSEKAAGYDLYSAIDYTINPGDKGLIPTDIAIMIPTGYYGRIAPRSSLAWKNHIDVGAGVIDEDYRGPVGVVLFNHSSEEFKITKGDRIAQLIITKIITPEVIVVENLDNTVRGSGGFGSTGTN